MLYTYGLRLGLHSILRGRVSREVIKNIVVPANYWRVLEYRLVFDLLEARSSDRILDIGSPKLLSLFLAEKLGAEVYSTDIDRYFIEDYNTFRALRGVPESRFHALEADGRRLQFPECYFTKIYSISVLEHIPEDGDSECMKEVARTLMPKGICVLTVPFSPVRREEFLESKDFYWSGQSKVNGDSQKVFFQRRYSERDLHDRLIGPSGLGLESLHFVGERIALGEGRELSMFLPPATGMIQPLMSTLFLTRPSTTWQQLRKPLAAVIVLRKQ